MFFHLKILLYGIRQKKYYLGLILVPSILYLMIQAYLPHQYNIVQDMQADKDTLLALNPNPLDLVRLERVEANPEILFTENLALMDLRNFLLVNQDMNRPEWYSWLPSNFATFVQRTVHGNFSLNPGEGNHFSLEYNGPDRDLGMALTSFYSQRLIDGARRAAERSLVMVTMEMAEIPGQTVSGIFADGPVRIIPDRVLYTPERAVPAAWILLVSAILVVSMIWVSQYMRPRLYSPRQASRYLDVKVLGTLPDLNKLKFN